jgi:hypothetical protein
VEQGVGGRGTANGQQGRGRVEDGEGESEGKEWASGRRLYFT